MRKTALTREDRQTYRERLVQLTDRLSAGVAQLEDEALRPTGSVGTAAEAPTHEPIATSNEADEDVARAVLMTEEQLLAEARAAIERLDEGTFGKCERCGRTIAKVRLNAIPYARDCIICARTANSQSAGSQAHPIGG